MAKQRQRAGKGDSPHDPGPQREHIEKVRQDRRGKKGRDGGKGAGKGDPSHGLGHWRDERERWWFTFGSVCDGSYCTLLEL